MIIFFAVLVVLGFVSLIAGLIGLIVDADPFGLFVGLAIGGAAAFIIFTGCGAAISNETFAEQAEQVEQTEHETLVEYNYCPYCGEALK